MEVGKLYDAIQTSEKVLSVSFKGYITIKYLDMTLNCTSINLEKNHDEEILFGFWDEKQIMAITLKDIGDINIAKNEWILTNTKNKFIEVNCERCGANFEVEID